MRLTSWQEKGLDWSLSDELTVLQTRIRSMMDKNVKLVDVIQVMLISPDPSMPEPGLPSMGVQSGQAQDPATLFRNYARGDLEGALQGQRDVAGDN